MLEIFKKRNWRPDNLEQCDGSFQGLNVQLSNVPCRVDEISGDRTYPYSDFGFEFIEELHKQLGDYKHVVSSFDSQPSMTASVTLRTYPPIIVKVSGKKPTSKGQYFSDLADALIDAFNSKGLKP